jgi:hypothetical protein
MKLHNPKRGGQSAKIGYILLWLLGVPIPILLIFFFDPGLHLKLGPLIIASLASGKAIEALLRCASTIRFRRSQSENRLKRVPLRGFRRVIEFRKEFSYQRFTE